MENIINVIGVNNIIIYLLIINLIGFLAMGIDKLKAKKIGGEFQKVHYS